MSGKPFGTRKRPHHSPSDNECTGDEVIKTASVVMEEDQELTTQLLKFSKEYHTTIDYILLASFQIILYRYGRQAEGGIASLRNHEVILIGNELNGEHSFTDYLRYLIAIKPERSNPNEELYTDYIANTGWMFVFEQDLANTTIDPFKQIAINNNIPLIFQAHDANLMGKLWYDTDLLTEATVVSIAAHYRQLLRSILKHPNEKIGTLAILTDEESNEQARFNATAVPYPMDKTLNMLLEEQVLKTPDHIALQLGEASMSYRELNERANQFARLIIEYGVKPGDHVGLLVQRSFDMIIGMYAIFKAGAAYIPVDPDYPVDRQRYILSNSAISLLLTDLLHPLNALIPQGKSLSMRTAAVDHYHKGNLNLAIDSRQLAYIIYTSGSTGKPKGVMIEHHSVVNLVLWVNHQFNIGVDDRLLFLTSMCFDLSVYDIFGILAAGGSLVIAEQAQISDINQLQQMLQDYRITFWDSVPTTLDYLVKELELTNQEYRQFFLRVCFLSGDWILLSLPERIKHFFPKASVISLGGATEATVWSNYFPVEKTETDWRSIPYGRPISNNFFYILNDQLQPVPAGVTGELFIGGVGVARGYANDAEKTAAAFLPDPFNSDSTTKMYRTGDLGRMLPNMNMEFLGRKDNQVKIRGFRVELGEIEQVLNQSEHLESAIVLAKEDQHGQKELIAYVVPLVSFDKNAIVSYLESMLPNYMIPLTWVEMQSLPLNINGKIDRKALLNIAAPPETSRLYVAPLTQPEKIMTTIWQQVFGMEKLGTNDNFFELGGHSIMAMQIVSRFEKETGTNLPAAILFKNPTISSLLAAIEKEDFREREWKSLIPIKPTGSKMPLYIVHGDGLYVLSFKDLAKYVDDEQPLFGLQPSDLKELDQTFETMADIARHYVDEILEHNPNGPYAVAGYSFGGYIAVEIEKQLTALGKEVKMLGIFDTDAENCFYNKPLRLIYRKKIIRQFPKLLWLIKSFIKHPSTTLNYQIMLFLKRLRKTGYSLGLIKKPKLDDVYTRIQLINQKHQAAFKAYNLTPFNNSVYLFKAKKRAYFVDDFRYLGWRKYAQKGVKVFEVPGDHATMLQQPNVCEFGRTLQNALDNS